MTRKDKSEITKRLNECLMSIDSWYKTILESTGLVINYSKGYPNRQNILLDYLDIAKSFRRDMTVVYILLAIEKTRRFVPFRRKSVDVKKILTYFKRSTMFKKELKTPEIIERIRYTWVDRTGKMIDEYRKKAQERGIEQYLIIKEDNEIGPDEIFDRDTGFASLIYIIPNLEALPNN